MSAFHYSALNEHGKLRKGVLEGDTPRQVRQLLRNKGLTPVEISEVSKKEAPAFFSFQIGKQIRDAELALVTRQLATLIRSGTSLEESLRAVADHSEQQRVKSILLAVRAKVLEGHPLAVALAKFPSVFQNLYRATIAAGERTGCLDVVLERLADYTEFSQQLRQKMMLALLYPILLTGVAFSVVAALMIYVVPQVIKVFDNIGQELPPLTRGLIVTSSFLKTYGVYLCIAGVCLVVVIRFLLRNDKTRYGVHRLLLTIPLAAKPLKVVSAARFARTFSVLVASSVSILESLHVSAQVVGNLVIREAITDVAHRVREGASLSGSLTKCGFFPPITLHMIASGEASSRLEEMLDRAAAIHEREIETMMAVTLGVLEPLLILVMGGIVLLIVLAILMPIFDLNQLVQ